MSAGNIAGGGLGGVAGFFSAKADREATVARINQARRRELNLNDQQFEIEKRRSINIALATERAAAFKEQQKAAIGGSGIAFQGSALGLLADTEAQLRKEIILLNEDALSRSKQLQFQKREMFEFRKAEAAALPFRSIASILGGAVKGAGTLDVGGSKSTTGVSGDTGGSLGFETVEDNSTAFPGRRPIDPETGQEVPGPLYPGIGRY